MNDDLLSDALVLSAKLSVAGAEGQRVNVTLEAPDLVKAGEIVKALLIAVLEAAQPAKMPPDVVRSVRVDLTVGGRESLRGSAVNLRGLARIFSKLDKEITAHSVTTVADLLEEFANGSDTRVLIDGLIIGQATKGNPS